MYHLKIQFNHGSTLEKISHNENELLAELDKYKKDGYNGTVVKMEETSYEQIVTSIQMDLERMHSDGSSVH